MPIALACTVASPKPSRSLSLAVSFLVVTLYSLLPVGRHAIAPQSKQIVRIGSVGVTTSSSEISIATELVLITRFLYLVLRLFYWPSRYHFPQSLFLYHCPKPLSKIIFLSTTSRPSAFFCVPLTEFKSVVFVQFFIFSLIHAHSHGKIKQYSPTVINTTGSPSHTFTQILHCLHLLHTLTNLQQKQNCLHSHLTFKSFTRNAFIKHTCVANWKIRRRSFF